MEKVTRSSFTGKLEFVLILCVASLIDQSYIHLGLSAGCMSIILAQQLPTSLNLFPLPV